MKENVKRKYIFESCEYSKGGIYWPQHKETQEAEMIWLDPAASLETAPLFPDQTAKMALTKEETSVTLQHS